jgi:hypothetical protein
VHVHGKLFEAPQFGFGYLNGCRCKFCSCQSVDKAADAADGTLDGSEPVDKAADAANRTLDGSEPVDKAADAADGA